VTDIVLLTQEGCASCRNAEALLARLAAEFPLTVSVMRFNTDEGQTLAEQAGIFFPPGILIDGEPFSQGAASERALRQEFARRHEAGR